MAKKVEVDLADNLPISEVGPWAERKHQIVSHYIRITGPSVRRQFANCAFVDVYCGPGRSRIKDSSTIIDGSPLVAWKASNDPSRWRAPFARVLIGDQRADFVSACSARLSNAPVSAFVGDALGNAPLMLAQLDPHAYTLVLVDPFDIKGLNFSLIEAFASLQRVDFIVHFSTMDVQRNLVRYFDSDESPLDAVVPRWRDALRKEMTNEQKLRMVFDDWKRLMGTLGFQVSSDPEAILNSKNRWIYWLACASRHPLAGDFWSKIKRLGPQGQLF